MSLKNKTLFITGASRGIGLAIALRAARDGANVVVAAKTTEPHPQLPGTIHTAAEAIERAGGHALRIAVNVRGTYCCSQACVPYLQKAPNPHILTLAPPLNMKPKWFKDHVAYTMSKYGMSMCTLGMAEEFRSLGIAVNSLWPRTTIATAAVEVHFPEAILKASRTAAIMADAAHVILTSDARANTGNFYIDEEVLKKAGKKDFEGYAVTPGVPLFQDLFVE